MYEAVIPMICKTHLKSDTYGIYYKWAVKKLTLQWHHNWHDGISNHQHHYCLLNRLFRRRSKITSKLRVTGLCVGNSLGTGEFTPQMASNAENVSIWWHHHAPLIMQVLVVDNAFTMAVTLRKAIRWNDIDIQNNTAEIVASKWWPFCSCFGWV